MAQERLEEIRQARLKKREELLASGIPAYPAEARRSHTLSEVNTKFEQLETDQTPVTLIGRIMSVRLHGGIAFIDIRDASDVFQLQISKESVEASFFDRLTLLDSGDWIQAAGVVTKTKRGVKSLNVLEWHMLAKSIRPLPDSWFGLKDHETRYRQREVDLLLNEEVKNAFLMRSKMVQWLREYMHNDGYIEVETPILQPIAGGAAAKPFETHHNALDMPLYLRIASELYLKRLLVGGFEKVFEIERRFRNEGVDRQHNPEFTMLESQWAYADYEDLMDFTEDVVEKMVLELHGSTTLTWQGTELSFKKPFKRERYVDLVSKRLGVDILKEKDTAVYVEIFKKEGLDLPEALSYRSLVDELYKELVRPTLIQPTLLYDYPVEMAPLAKENANQPGVAEKFQLLICGMEINNCYTELNDPVLQAKMFASQEQDRAAGDTEAQTTDRDYLRAMEYGMPPNAGWSLGIDRMVMLLTDSANVRDTILFPLLKPEDHA